MSKFTFFIVLLLLFSQTQQMFTFFKACFSKTKKKAVPKEISYIPNGLEMYKYTTYDKAVLNNQKVLA